MLILISKSLFKAASRSITLSIGQVAVKSQHLRMASSFNTDAVRIVEVGPRDGLQNISSVIPTPIKLELIERLRNTGLQNIELTSIVSPRAVPQLSDCRTVLNDSRIQSWLQLPDMRWPVLIPNLKGFEIAKQSGVREVAVFVSASEGFSRANIKCSVQEGLDRAREVAAAARECGIQVRGYISCVFHCPFDGATPPSAVMKCVAELRAMGCYEISLGDTVGSGVAADVVKLMTYLKAAGIPMQLLAGHFHDTYGQAVANVWTAYQCGIRVFDSSVAGLGGCPYAPGAKGNVATEDVVYMFQQAGIETGVNLPELVNVGVWISEQLKSDNSSRAGKALASKQARRVTSSPSVQIEPTPRKGQNGILWKPFMSSEGLEILRSGTNVKIILNRPSNGNALTIAMISGLTNFFERAASDSSITRIAVMGRGKHFCTGMDLARGSTPVAQGNAASEAQYQRLTQLFSTIDKAPQVTIACIQGSAFGGGVGLAFACDIRLMATKATFTLSEAKLGLSPATISKYVIREWGAAFSREAMLSARPVSASELVRLGTVAEVVDTDTELSDALDAYIVRLKKSAPNASAMSKELVKLGCLDGGHGSKQEIGIRELFDKMMSGNHESAYGLAQFQAGNKAVDWDEYVLNKSELKSKL